MTNADLISIDAVKTRYGWEQNDCYRVAKIPCWLIKASNRMLLKYLRAGGFVSEATKGRLFIERDETHLTIYILSNMRPLYCIELGDCHD